MTPIIHKEEYALADFPPDFPANPSPFDLPLSSFLTTDFSFAAKLFSDKNQVPRFRGYQIIDQPEHCSSIAHAAIQLLYNGEVIASDMTKNIDKAFNRACILITHGQKTGQLRSFRKGSDHFLFPKILAIQLMQLNISEVNENGRLDPRLTVLNDFIAENQDDCNIKPLIEDRDDKQQVSKSRKLAFN